MARSKPHEIALPKKLDDLVEFFDTHDLGDYFERMPEAHFVVDIKKRTHLIAIDEEIADQITAIAKSKKTSSESLVNSWLKESIQKTT
ncbi:MAG TPA: CopG family antitoxin [Blastocatellia bacterium]|nr:CopG family antitoxin [Blastocatellia bacterium]